jgi:hypothetical protein
VAIDIRASLDRNALRSISKQSGLSVFAHPGGRAFARRFVRTVSSAEVNGH